MSAFHTMMEMDEGMVKIRVNHSCSQFEFYNIVKLGEGYLEVVYGNLQFARLVINEDWEYEFNYGTLLHGMRPDDNFTSLTVVGKRKGADKPEVQINFLCTVQYEKIVRAIVSDKMGVNEAFAKFTN